MANINTEDVVWDTEIIDPQKVQWDPSSSEKSERSNAPRFTLKELGGDTIKQGSEFAAENIVPAIKSMLEGIVNPLYRTSAHALQGVEGLVRGGKMTTYKNPITGDVVAPMENKNAIQESIGNALQTASVVIPPGAKAGLTTLGAMYGGGQALEAGKSPAEIAKAVILSGLAGKGFGVASGESLLTGQVGKFARNKIVPALESGAEKSYGKVLGAKTKSEKLTAEKLLPRVAEEKPFVLTRSGLLRASERKQGTAGEALSDAYARLNPKDKISISPILDRIDKAKGELSVKGVLLEQNKPEVAVLDQLRQDLIGIAGRGKTDPLTLREYRQQLDSYIAARKKGFAQSDADSSALNARRVMANSIRKELANKYPDIAKLNAEFSFQNNMVNLLESTVAKQKSPLSEVSGMIGEVAGNRATGFFIRNLGSLFSDNVAWNSLAGSMKSRLAEQLAKGNIEAANYTLIGAMNKWNEDVGPTLNRFGSRFSSRKPVQVYGSQDEYLGGLWKDLAGNEKGSIASKSLGATAGLTAGALGAKNAFAMGNAHTLGQRNNNPINLKGVAKWAGMTGQDKFGHAQFGSLEEGIRAGLVNLRTHQLRNPEESLRKYMRSFKTAKGDYQAEFIAKALGISPDTKMKDLDMGSVIIPLAKIESKIRLTSEQIEKVKKQFNLK